MKKITPAQKKIYEILGFVDTKKAQASVKLPTDLIERVEEASIVLDIFICDIYESALTKLLDELQPLIDQKKNQEKENEKNKNAVSITRGSSKKTPRGKKTITGAAS